MTLMKLVSAENGWKVCLLDEEGSDMGWVFVDRDEIVRFALDAIKILAPGLYTFLKKVVVK